MKIKVDDSMMLDYTKWEAKAAKACVLIVHGMAEHSKRYHDFATHLIQTDVQVYAYDQRGHGSSVKSIDEIGYFGKGGWTKVIEDVGTMLSLIKEENPNVPVYLMGHSMGSFVAREYASHHSFELDGLIISGTGASSGIQGKLLTGLTKLQSKLRGPAGPCTFVDNITKKTFNKNIKPLRTNFDWLSRDEKEVDKYIADPYCGTVFSCSFFSDLFQAVERVNSVAYVDRMNKTLPIYIFSGAKDPIGEHSVGVKKVHALFEACGFSDLSMKLYKDGRHEMLNELNKNEVFEDVKNWLNNKI